ncbi:Diacetylchitobiose binding protein DasA [Baekduia alba]|uniref:ABC transporter substrate-binding protein n=1 Tax=Baekduia alba TaxID=2997333 RepID=UPI00233FFF89|nr:ABC transporter substrate-binding protein [Baekduia alba]WCB93455.1 Diacetylchitobiose binding protein DasA [Baekduia alba]
MRSALRMIILAAVAAALAATMTACGSSSSTDDKGEVVITCSSCQSSPSDPSLQFAAETAKTFNQRYAGKYHIKVVKNQNAGSGPDRLQYYQRLALADDLPDVFQVNPPELRSLAKTGKVMNFAPVLDKDAAWKDSFNAGVFTALTGEDDQVWAIPETRDAIGIYYNKAIFKEAGIAAFPQTWAEFEADCAKIKAAGKTCFAMDGDWVTLLMWANLIGTQPGGVTFLDQGIKGGNYADSAVAVKATDTLRRWHDAGYINTNAFSGEYQNAATAFVRGQAAMVANGPWMVNSDIKTKNAVKGLYDQVGYEQSPGWTADQRGLIVISAEGSYASGAHDARKQEAVTAFMKLLTSHAQSVEQIKVEGAWPAAKFEPTAAEKKDLEPLAAGLVKASTTVPLKFPHAFYNAPEPFESSWKNLWPAYVKNKMSTQDFLSKLAHDAQSTTG